jgi:hypothetical protein
MKCSILYILITCAFCPSINAQQTPATPSQEDLTRLDFWLGSWNLTWEGGKGLNTIEKTLDGRVVQEHFEATEGGMKGFKGTSISTFNPRDGQWHQAWADNQGGYIDLIGIMDDNQKIFQTTKPRTMPDGTSVIFRMRFYDITENSLTWDWESSPDEGKTWELSWRIYYSRE